MGQKNITLHGTTLSKDPLKKKEFTLTNSNFFFSSSNNKLSSINKIKSLFQTNKNKPHVSRTRKDATTTVNQEFEKHSSNSFEQTISADNRENLQKLKNNLQISTEKLKDIPVKKKSGVFDPLGLSQDVSPFSPLRIMKHKTAEKKELSLQSLTSSKEVTEEQNKYWKSKISGENNKFGPYLLENIPSSNFKYKEKKCMDNKKNKQPAQIHFMKVKI